MGLPVFIVGKSGTGKTTSLRNFEPSEVSVFNVAGKPFPFRKKLPCMNNANYDSIMNYIVRPNGKKVYVIDDSQYLMAFDCFDKAKVSGWDKWLDMAVNFEKLIRTVVNSTPKDTIVYFLHHSELCDDGTYKMKTIGKMLDEKMVLEGRVSIVLYTAVDAQGYWFVTNTDGTNTAKSPMEMFERKIPNDLKFVDKTIREYYGIDDLDSNVTSIAKPIAQAV